MVDGNGYLHPRRSGIATHLGVELDHPTIGIAKTLLCGTVNEINLSPGGHRVIKNADENKDAPLGYSIKTSSRANPIYVSVGNKISLEQAGKLSISLSNYKLPEPIRKAHNLATSKA